MKPNLGEHLCPRQALTPERWYRRGGFWRINPKLGKAERQAWSSGKLLAVCVFYEFLHTHTEVDGKWLHEAGFCC